MPEYTIEAAGDAREVYGCTAENEEDAREKFDRGELGQPSVTEVCGSFIVSIKEES